MNDLSNAPFPFTEIPLKYKSLKDNLTNEELKRLYSKFSFICFDQNEDNSEDILHDYLKTNKFFIYFRIPNLQNQEIESFDSILCFENHCLFIESSQIISFKQMLEDNNSLFIDLDSADINIKNEISAFCSYFQKEMNSNYFINLTLKPISAYIIRRFFLPSNYFKDSSFFSFMSNFNEENRNDFTNFDFQKMLEKVTKDKQNLKCPISIVDFEEKDFIRLRQIYADNKALFYLVIHTKSFYIFMMKKTPYELSHEIDFDNKYKYRCLTPFYGYIKTKGTIVGFVYEFMSNGTLSEYLAKNKDNTNTIFAYMTMVRIAQGIKYLHSNSLIHRDIKPKNILIDHNHIPYLSDFDTIREIEDLTSKITHDIGSLIYASPEQHNEETYSFPTDIYSFGQLIYFIFVKEDNKKGSNLLKSSEEIENKIPKLIQNIFKACISFEAKDRPTINEINNFLYDIFSSFNFLKIPCLKEIIDIMNLTETQQYFKEIYYLLFVDKDADEYYLHKYEIQLFEIINFINKVEASIVLYSVGKFYYDGKIVEQDFLVAKEFFEFAAELNNVEAFFHLGLLYDIGQGVAQDYPKAIKYYEIAAKQNHYTAMNCLGIMYKNGYGVEIDYHKAKEYYELSAKHNDTALCNLGYLYQEGLGVEKSIEKAIECYELSAKQNNSMAMSDLGVLYLTGQGVEQNIQKAKEYFESAAKLNNSNALSNLGILYYTGNGVEQSYEKAREYFELSAKQDDPYALTNLGLLYFEGKGVKKNYEKAKYYFELAAKHDFYMAKYNLGLIYKKGLGVAKDIPKARYYFESSSSNTNSPSFYQLGKLYYYGIDVEQDYEKAKFYFEKSANQNYNKSIYQLGMLYKKGHGVEQDYSQALKYFELAALLKNPKASYQIGILHFYGLIENHDLRKAREYFEISSKSNLNSNFFLGLIYENGIGIDRDVNKSIEYYKQCSNTKISKHLFQSIDKYVYEEKLIYNEYYYQSHNALGLIYLTEKQFENQEIAEIHLKEAGLNEYPYGQNSLGLYQQFYLNQIGNAQYLFEKASKSCFALSEYNLGHIYEERGNIEEAIEHYSKASDYEGEEIFFRKHKIEDERLEISKSFIICYTNLKLSHYYLAQSEVSLNEFISDDFFMKAIFRPLFLLIFHSKNCSYTFCFKAIKSGENYIITNLKEFILNNPLFHSKKELTFNSQASRNSFGWSFEQSKKKGKIELNLIIRKVQENIHPKSDGNKNNDEFASENFIMKEKCTANLNDELNSNGQQDDDDEGACSRYENESIFNNKEKIEEIFNFMNKGMKYELIKNENENNISHDINNEILRIIEKRNKVERDLKYPRKLCQMLSNSVKENQQELFDIIDNMKVGLYEKPYKILFGRIGIYISEKIHDMKEEAKAEYINDNFIGGIGDD